MPRIEVRSADGYCWQIATRQVETILRAWFDEVLPWCQVIGRPGVDDFDVLWPRITVWPMWAWKHGPPSDPDWLCDSRVLGRLHPFPAADGDSGLRELATIRRELEAELRAGRFWDSGRCAGARDNAPRA